MSDSTSCSRERERDREERERDREIWGGVEKEKGETGGVMEKGKM